eukprot:TRINITY_DN8542_c0_g1_i15.p1 TRINITY_DN8542_c0_g1~~TRINITY_DN8542_c0_g1_i15.p1  ORF type:complete len:263 (+),score=23.40 TRINITY_DN8542_c0_g1_i15:365-1153(+)
MFLRTIVTALVLSIGYMRYLKPVMDSTSSSADLVCGSDLNFAYVSHPMSTLPYFTEIRTSDNTSFSTRCFHAAKYETLRIRAGFDPLFVDYRNETLYELMNGTSAECFDPGKGKRPRVACPTGPFGKMSDMTKWNGEDSGPFCEDMDVHYMVVRQTCVDGSFEGKKFIDLFPGLQLLGNKHSCADTQSLCTCSDNGGECRPRGNNYTREGVEWDFDMSTAVKLVCGLTCGQCSEMSDQGGSAPSPGGGPGGSAPSPGGGPGG